MPKSDAHIVAVNLQRGKITSNSSFLYLTHWTNLSVIQPCTFSWDYSKISWRHVLWCGRLLHFFFYLKVFMKPWNWLRQLGVDWPWKANYKDVAKIHWTFGFHMKNYYGTGRWLQGSKDGQIWVATHHPRMWEFTQKLKNWNSTQKNTWRHSTNTNMHLRGQTKLLRHNNDNIQQLSAVCHLTHSP